MVKRRTSRSGLTLGVIGSGEVSAESVDALLSDFIDSEGGGEATIVLPATADHYEDGIKTVFEFAVENELGVEVITDDSTKGKKFAKVKDEAKKEHRASDVVVTMIEVLEKAGDKARLIVLWDDDDEAVEEAVTAADEAGIEALDLTTGLDVIELEDDDEEEDEKPKKSAKSKDDDEEDEGGDDLPDPDGDDDAEDDEIDLDTAEFPELKEFAQKHGIEVAPRSKRNTYVREIQKYLEEQEASSIVSGDEDDETTAGLPEVSTSRETVAEALSGPVVNVQAGGAAVSLHLHVEDWEIDDIVDLVERLKAL